MLCLGIKSTVWTRTLHAVLQLTLDLLTQTVRDCARESRAWPVFPSMELQQARNLLSIRC